MKKGIEITSSNFAFVGLPEVYGGESLDYDKLTVLDYLGVSDFNNDFGNLPAKMGNRIDRDIFLVYRDGDGIIYGVDGHGLGDYPGEFLYERLWISVTEIDAGFITEEQEYTITFWNAYQEDAKSITAVSVVGGTGTSLTYPTLPDIIPQTWYTSYTLTVFEVGPPTQDTTYTITFGGEDLTVEVAGMRVLAVEPAPDWGGGIKDIYEYHTAMFNNARFKEQRRPLTDKPERKMSVTYLLNNNPAHRLNNSTLYGHDKVFAVPVYREAMIPSALALDSDTIYLSSDIDYLWNLNNFATYVFIADHTNEIFEIKEIDSINIGLKTITVTRAITKTYTDLSRTFVYPVFLGIVGSVSFDEETDDIETIEIEFREYWG